MRFKCRNCREYIVEGQKYCVLCGAPTDTAIRIILDLTPFPVIYGPPPVTEIFVCNDCGHAYRDVATHDARFCPECGGRCTMESDEPRFCGNCSEELQGGDRYCRFCGADAANATHTVEDTADEMHGIYGPPPEERMHVCHVCGYAWKTFSMIDRERFCPMCGGEAEGTEVSEEDDGEEENGMTAECGFCRAELAKGQKYCMRCGAPAAAAMRVDERLTDSAVLYGPPSAAVTLVCGDCGHTFRRLRMDKKERLLCPVCGGRCSEAEER